ncbi:hypothetical protein [Ideonella sp. YS5]|uniref:hypothetical protein n=1 Tax=Ideonella sp. YS5 TaxID=3453714 RepID=UPI003EEA6615
MASTRPAAIATAANEAQAASSAPAPATQPYPDLYGLWLQSLARALEARSPLSGDVTQWIRAWGEAVGQVGLFNLNIAGSSDPQAERRIGGQYSYGRQLGRLTEVLEPFVHAHEGEFRKEAGDKAVDDFLKMVADIKKLKQASVEDIVAKVRQWRDEPDFEKKLRELQAQLKAISKA